MTVKSKDAEKVLETLKDFQLRTAKYVFRRFFTDENRTSRFLIADEVGLGKTLVARGIIALAIDYLREKSKRIDIVYICSNTSIASQNINRLSVSGLQEFIKPTRLSLLPLDIDSIKDNQVNYISLTPGTSFDLKSREGRYEERVLIYQILREAPHINRSGLRRLLQCHVKEENWNRMTRRAKPDGLDANICEKFIESVSQDESFFERLRSLSEKSREQMLRDTHEKLDVVSELRFRLAEASVDILEPDLIILDEFQRFKKILDDDNIEARLAQKLFKKDNAKTLLLSATPYKMLSMNHEKEENHYTDFIKSLKFLLNSDSKLAEIEKDIHEFRRYLYFSGDDKAEALMEKRNSVEHKLKKVMCRTERVGSSSSRNAMLSEHSKKPHLQSADIQEAVLADKIASCVGAGDIIEYWKSSPYLINFLRKYEFRRKLESSCENPTDELLSALKANSGRLLQKRTIHKYKEIIPPNPKMRDLCSLTLDKGLWKVLWLSPSMPYSTPAGAFAEITDATKYLVFSAWNVVPDAIASLCSYEAERRMLSGFEKEIKHDQIHDELKPLIKFTRSPEGRLTGMSSLVLLYPSPGLASLLDPLKIAMDYQGSGTIPVEELLNKAESMLRPALDELLSKPFYREGHGQEDQRWYWAAPALIDSMKFKNTKNWILDNREGWEALSREKRKEEISELFIEHLRFFKNTMDNKIDPKLGRPPQDLLKVLSLLAVAGPGVSALRALKRQAPKLSWDNNSLLSGAARISEGFRTLFNLPESIALLRTSKDMFYWRLVLQHCLEGNIQSLLDEQAHCLLESLGLINEPEDERASEIGTSISSSLSIRTSQLQLDEVTCNEKIRRINFKSYKTRCRFALRFSEIKDDSGAILERADTVRNAFNSPFRPFVLASTSIGQEGLDFHTWCHSVVHWNLPNNPVDLEQREGRVHRYKGHAIRKNLTLEYGLKELKDSWNCKGDPWKFMFELAKENRPANTNDLHPYWIFEVEGGAQINRLVPILSYSRDEPNYQRLKKLLAIYRLVFGQPRQEDLLEYLAEQAKDSKELDCLNKWEISLKPPEG